MTPAEFQQLLAQKSAEDIVSEKILSNGSFALTDDLLDEMHRDLCAAFNLGLDKVKIYVVGSGKLGFSIAEKFDKKNRILLPRYRSFSAESDIDIAVVSQTLYYLIWRELAAHAHDDDYYMRNSEQGAYMLWGWLRPDFFPKSAKLTFCERWWHQFYSYSADTRFGRRDIRGGLYYTKWFLEAYQQRAVRACQLDEELKR